jgi:importin subunit alpha-1
MSTVQARRNKRISLKNGIDFAGGRRRRNNDGIELRKNRRLQGLQKRRAIYSSPTAIEDQQHATDDMKLDNSELKLPPFLSELSLTMSDSVVELLTRSSNSATNHANTLTPAGSRVSIRDMVVNSGVVPLLVKNLLSDKEEIREQSALCIGNIAGEMHELRDYAIQCGVISPILQNITNAPNEKFLEKIVWSLSNLCRGKQTSEMNNIIPVFPVLINLLSSTHEEILLNTCWALSYLTEGNDTVTQALIENESTSKFISFLSHENTKIIHIALRILGNFILSGHVQEVVDAGIMIYTNALFTNHDRDVRYEICYLISLIVYSGTESIDLLINSPSVLQMIISMMQNSVLNERMEATWVIFNIANKGTDLQLQVLADLGAIPALCHNLEVPDIKFILIVLDSIENFLMVGERLNFDYKILLEECGGREKMDALMSHQSDEVYRKSNSISEEFFEEKNEDWDEEEVNW